ncbi:MAG: hypothetical protein K2L94_00610 [Alphaproteobacteria bacterium]|nr:hypothetical protein [Alphaproteobacteria bacterium]
MIDTDAFLSEIKTGAWCAGGGDAGDLARAASRIADGGISLISVAPNSIAVMWPWLEKMPVKMLGRFYMESAMGDGEISELARRMNAAFKQGAAGAQVFLRRADLANFVDNLHLIRDDLFFNKYLAVGMDIGEIDMADWPTVFALIDKIRADALTLIMPDDAGDASDFVGRIYGLMTVMPADVRWQLHFALGNNFMRMEQAWRLIQKMRPKLADGVRFFVNYEHR